MITSRDKGTSVFVNPTEMEDASTYKPNVSFNKVGDQHFLSAFRQQIMFITSAYPVRSSWRPPLKPHDTVSVSGSGGSK